MLQAAGLSAVIDRRYSCLLQQIVSGSTTALGCDPIDNLVGIHDVAGFAVNTVGGVNLQTLSSITRFRHFINSGRAKELARITIFIGAARMAYIGLNDDQMAGLVFI